MQCYCVGNGDKFEKLKMLSVSDIMLCDGTFWVTPTMFYQMYSFHSSVAAHKSLPMLYSLLPDKDDLIGTDNLMLKSWIIYLHADTSDKV